MTQSPHEDRVVSGETVTQERAQQEKPPQTDIKTGHEVPTKPARAAFGLPLLLLLVAIVGAIIVLALFGI